MFTANLSVVDDRKSNERKVVEAILALLFIGVFFYIVFSDFGVRGWKEKDKDELDEGHFQ